MAWHFKKVKFCKDNEVGPYSTGNSSSGDFSQGGGGGNKRRRPVDGDGDGGGGGGGDTKRSRQQEGSGGSGAAGVRGEALLLPPVPPGVVTHSDVVAFLQRQRAAPRACPDILLRAQAGLPTSTNPGSGRLSTQQLQQKQKQQQQQQLLQHQQHQQLLRQQHLLQLQRSAR